MPDPARDMRLDANTKTLYCCTSGENAAHILSTGRMVRSAAGSAGGGIYFVTTPGEASRGSPFADGTVLQATVRLGHVLHASPGQYPHMTFTKLKELGYDSVCVGGFAHGPEYVVYNWDQVKHIATCEDPSE